VKTLPALLLLIPALGSAQAIGGGVGSSLLRVRSTVGAAEEVLSGTLMGGEARVEGWGLALDIAYAQGDVTPDSGTPAARDVIEGRILLGNRPWRGLSVKAGPHVRSYVTASGTQRWFFWEARLRGEGTIVGRVQVYAEIWRVLSGNVNVVEAFDGGQGGEAGLLLRLPRSPFWGRLAYGIERAKLGGGARLETVEGLSLAVGYGLR
jgi:hypothetical protein